MAITYRGITAFTLQSEEPSGSYYELPTITRVYKGAATEFDTFWSANPLGKKVNDGYLVDRRGRNTGMYPEILLVIATPPDFGAYTLARSRATQTASKGRTVSTSTVISGASEVEANRTISFIAPQSIYSYWSSHRPTGPRYTGAAAPTPPIMLRSVITATANGSTRTYYGNAPGALVSALTMPAVALVTGHQADPIPRTPWYRCSDTVSYVFRGDE